MGSIESFKGESIEKKVSKLIENNKPITDGAPIIFTEKKDRVLPQYSSYRDWETKRRSHKNQGNRTIFHYGHWFNNSKNRLLTR